MADTAKLVLSAVHEAGVELRPVGCEDTRSGRVRRMVPLVF